MSSYSSADFTELFYSFFKIDSTNIRNDPRTTIMIKNIPNKYAVHDLSSEIDQNLANTYDFLYLPCDLKVKIGFI